MWVRGDDRLVLVRVCGQWHQGFAKEGDGDIDKKFHIIMSYDSLLLIKRKWMQYIVFLKLSRPSMLIKVSGTRLYRFIPLKRY